MLIDFCDPQGGDAGLRCTFGIPQQTLVAHTLAEVKPLLDQVEALSQQGCWCAGYVRYEAAPAFDAALTVHPAEGPLAWFGVYPQALPWPNQPPENAAPKPPTVAKPTRLTWHNTLSRADFDHHMASIHQAIAAGEFYQVNFTAPLTGAFDGEALDLFHRLHRAQPKGYGAFMDTGFEQVLSVSPELFFDWPSAPKPPDFAANWAAK